jgi:hypothetical protein
MENELGDAFTWSSLPFFCLPTLSLLVVRLVRNVSVVKNETRMNHACLLGFLDGYSDDNLLLEYEVIKPA